jgi:hypothetical protein
MAAGWARRDTSLRTFYGKAIAKFNIINLIGPYPWSRFITIERLKDPDSREVPEAIG